MKKLREIRVEAPRLDRGTATQRVAARVNGETLYFESPNAELRPSPEAFVAALLVPALVHGADLVLAAPLDPIFLAGVPRLLNTFSEWWGYQKIEVCAETPPAAASTDVTKRSTPRGNTALCFSGGADSFFSLLCPDERIDSLIFVHGFDIPLADTERAALFRTSFDCIAREVSAQPVLLRTNLRDHPVTGRANWVHAHGGALAAVGHLVADTQRLVVAASIPIAFPQPWGSRWDVDPHWSSGRMQVVHHGAERWRSEKLRSVASNALVRSHLRVCWEHLGRAANCSRCEKCVRTMLTLAQCGALEEFPVFDSGGSLAERVTGLGYIDPMLHPVYQAFLEPEIDRETSNALRALLAVSQVPPKRDGHRVRWKRIKHALFG